MNSKLLYYQSIHKFKKLYYGHLLLPEHLVQRSQINLRKLYIPGDPDPIEGLNIWGYWLVKDGVNYIIDSVDDEKNEIDINKTLPFEAQDCLKVSDSSGKVYWYVRRPIKKSFDSEKMFSPKEFINNLASLEHNNKKHLILMFLMALSQLWDRAYYRISSPAGMGKDSVVDICSSFFGECGSITSPSAAKLADRAVTLKWLVVNEVVDIGKSDWDTIQQFLLDAGAHRNEVTKSTRAFQNVGEIMDISDFSMSLFYNDIDHYRHKGEIDPKQYFDNVTKGAVLDRFPAFRLYGKYIEDFNSIGKINITRLVRDEFEFYTDMLRTYTYYKNNFRNHLHNWDTKKLHAADGRDAINLGKLLNLIDFYCDTQVEFDEWVDIINKTRIDYTHMLMYPDLIEKLKKQVPNKKYHEYEDKLIKVKTFTEKNKLIQKWLSGEETENTDDRAVWDFDKLDKEIL